MQKHTLVCFDCTLQFAISMTGGWSGGAIKNFWNHCFQQEEWYEHPAKYMNINWERHSKAALSRYAIAII